MLNSLWNLLHMDGGRVAATFIFQFLLKAMAQRPLSVMFDIFVMFAHCNCPTSLLCSLRNRILMQFIQEASYIMSRLQIGTGPRNVRCGLHQGWFSAINPYRYLSTAIFLGFPILVGMTTNKPLVYHMESLAQKPMILPWPKATFWSLRIHWIGFPGENHGTSTGSLALCHWLFGFSVNLPW